MGRGSGIRGKKKTQITLEGCQMNRTKVYIIIILYILINPYKIFAYDDLVTHPALTENAVKKSIIVSESYLSNNLGDAFLKNENATIMGKKVYQLIKDGSTEEDTPNCRAASHFLNPLKGWETAGVSDTNETILGAFVITPVCFATDPFSSRFSLHKYSDVTWATGLTSPTAQISDTGNDMDWNAARKYYRLALTATDNAAREAYFAQTFQALGQVMHLLQDMAVPAHVRNDFTAHLAFQKVNGLLPSKWYGNTYEWYVKNNENLVNSAMTSSAVVRPPNNLLTALWDANKYDGNNPSGGTVQGLSEYTNANFFSESTIFAELKDPTDIHYFPRPNKADTNALEQEMLATTMEVTAEDGVQDRTIYVTKNTGGYKVAAYSFLGQRVARRIVADGIAPFSYVSEWEYNLDDEVYKDYIQKLIPRAVGYSAALLDYFFRGQIDMTAESGQYVIKNESDEAMSGTFRLYYDDTTGIRQLVPAADWYLSIAAKGVSSPVTFTAPSDAKEPGKYMLVFLGTHGAESGAVVGKAFLLDSKPRGRMAVIYRRKYPTVRVATNTWVKDVVLPTTGFIRALAIRFDIANPDDFVVAALYPLQGGLTTEYHSFHIDDEAQTVTYSGKIMEERQYHSKNSYELVWHDTYSFYDTDMYIGEDGWHPCLRMANYLSYDQQEPHNISDIFIKNGEIIQQIKIYSFVDNRIIPCAQLLYSANNICTNDVYEERYGCGNSYLLSGIHTSGVYYNNIRTESVVNFGQELSEEVRMGDFSSLNNVVAPKITKHVPYPILSEHNYAYAKYEYNDSSTIINYQLLASDNNLQLPQQTIKFNGTYYMPTMFSMLRADGKYALYFEDRKHIGLPTDSYSSETGWLGCTGFLLGANQIGWRITDSSSQIVKFQDCDNWQVLDSLPLSIGGSDEVPLFDVRLF